MSLVYKSDLPYPPALSNDNYLDGDDKHTVRKYFAVLGGDPKHKLKKRRAESLISPVKPGHVYDHCKSALSLVMTGVSIFFFNTIFFLFVC